MQRDWSKSQPDHAKATTIMGLFWENFQKSEPAFIMRDVIAIEIAKAVDAERERCAALVERADNSMMKQDALAEHIRNSG